MLKKKNNPKLQWEFVVPGKYNITMKESSFTTHRHSSIEVPASPPPRFFVKGTLHLLLLFVYVIYLQQQVPDRFLEKTTWTVFLSYAGHTTRSKLPKSCCLQAV